MSSLPSPSSSSSIVADDDATLPHLLDRLDRIAQLLESLAPQRRAVADDLDSAVAFR